MRAAIRGMRFSIIRTAHSTKLNTAVWNKQSASTHKSQERQETMASTCSNIFHFALLPDGCKVEVAAFLLPFEAYNLCLTSKHFHSQRSLSLLSTRVLKSSLLSSLAKVLRHNETGITLENLACLQRLLTRFGLPANSFFLSGSTIVQACLGVLWEKSTNVKTDVDIFCSQDAAPIVRSWLVTANAAGPGHHIFTGAHFGYFDQSHFVVQESPISHVEKFGKFTSTMKPPVGTVSTDQHQLCLESEESTKNAIQHGGSKQTKHLQDGIFVCTHNGDPVPFLPKSVTKNLYRMRVEDSVQFEDKVDLVVAKRLSSALDLINNFDLDICRCSFNGINFSIPNPHNVFKNKQAPESPFVDPITKTVISCPSTVAGSRLDCLKTFFLPIVGDHPQETTLERVRSLRTTMPCHPFVTYVFLEEDEEGNTKFTRAHFIHVFIQRQVARLAKYRRRGVEVEGTEMIPSDYVRPSIRSSASPLASIEQP